MKGKAATDRINFNYLFPELTAKQYTVLEMFSLGAQQKQVAAQLEISTDAVKQHMNVIKKKLACQNTSEIRYIYLTRIMHLMAMGLVNQTVNIDFEPKILPKKGSNPVESGCNIMQSNLIHSEPC